MMSNPDALSSMTVWLNVLYLLCRYAHLVSAMLLVGGILFYEMVVPPAISELTEPAQLAVFARARWVFRWVIYACIVVFLASGSFMTFWRMQAYIEGEFVPTSLALFSGHAIPWPLRTGWWWAAHVTSGVFALIVAARMVIGDRPMAHPVTWMRLDLMLLLITIFFATVTRQVDQIHVNHTIRGTMPPALRYAPEPQEPGPGTSPSTQPAIP